LGIKRSLFGYRRGDVEDAIAARDSALEAVSERLSGAYEQIEEQAAEVEARGIELAGRERRIDDLERIATRLSERVVTGERELRRMRTELAALRSERDGHLASMTALMGEIEELRRTARGQATRIRMRALRDAAGMAERISELAKQPAEMREKLLEGLNEAIGRIGGEDEGEDGAEVVAGGAAEMAEIAVTNGHDPEAEAADIFEGLIEVEIGPLADFAQLVGFEDAARSIEATEEISVRRFSEGRATLAMELSSPVELLRELEERCDLEFVVRDLREDRLVLDVGA
jgi:hypothetical protein